MTNFVLLISMLLISVGLNATAQIFLRLGVMGKDLTVSINSILLILLSMNVWYGIFCYMMSIFLWLFVLSKTQVSLAYPFQAIGYAFGTFLAWYFLNEKITSINILGLIVIVLGILILSIGIYSNEK
ncbi:EamA family transporter [bacterium]|nr:EamA family transporter [bacterium]